MGWWVGGLDGGLVVWMISWLNKYINNEGVNEWMLISEVEGKVWIVLILLKIIILSFMILF